MSVFSRRTPNVPLTQQERAVNDRASAMLAQRLGEHGAAPLSLVNIITGFQNLADLLVAVPNLVIGFVALGASLPLTRAEAALRYRREAEARRAAIKEGRAQELRRARSFHSWLRTNHSGLLVGQQPKPNTQSLGNNEAPAGMVDAVRQRHSKLRSLAALATGAFGPGNVVVGVMQLLVADTRMEGLQAGAPNLAVGVVATGAVLWTRGGVDRHASARAAAVVDEARADEALTNLRAEEETFHSEVGYKDPTNN